MKQRAKRGFTLVELAFSILFIGILSVALALIISNTLATYRRGLTLNRLNQTGQAIIDDMRVSVQNSSSESALDLCAVYYDDKLSDGLLQRQNCEQDGGKAFISLTKTAAVRIGGEVRPNVPVYGIFCTGEYSYIWASGYFESGESNDNLVQETGRPTFKYNGGSIDNFRLLKIADSRHAVCASVARPYQNNGYNSKYQNADSINLASSIDVTNGYDTITEAPTELLTKTNEADLVIYDFRLANPAESLTARNTFYAASFILGTKNDVNIYADGNKCSPPNDSSAVFETCAINKFSFAAQTNNEGV